MPSPLFSATIPLPPPPPPPPSKWGPYSSSKDFDANMAALVLVLVCAAALAFALHAALRLLLRRRRPQSTPRDPAKPPAEATPPSPPLPGSVVAFAAGATALAGAPECAICLSELAEGEPVRVIPACGHGFHALCVDAWLLGRASCPTCRTECRPADAEP